MPGFFLLSQDKGACCLISIKMNPKIAEEHAVRPYMAAQSRISEFAKSHNLKSRPHAMLWFSKVYGIPAGMYVSQVWGTVYLSEGSEFGSQLQIKEASVFLEAHSWSEEQHNKLGGA
jgi:hypothetical protein